MESGIGKNTSKEKIYPLSKGQSKKITYRDDR